MSRRFDSIPVYTKDSVITTDDDKKKQAMIDEWTDELAIRMADKTDYIMLDDGTVIFDRRKKRGGHNRQTIEMLNSEGYVVRIFQSIAEAAKHFDVGNEAISRVLNGIRKSPFIPGYTLRRRETERERRKREKANIKANKKREKTINKKKRNYGKTRKKTD